MSLIYFKCHTNIALMSHLKSFVRRISIGFLRIMSHLSHITDIYKYIHTCLFIFIGATCDIGTFVRKP